MYFTIHTPEYWLKQKTTARNHKSLVHAFQVKDMKSASQSAIKEDMQKSKPSDSSQVVMPMGLLPPFMESDGLAVTVKNSFTTRVLYQ